MLVILFCFFVSTILFSLFGSFFVLYFDKKNEQYSFFDTFFIGFCFVGTILNLWSIFFPTNTFSLLFLFLLALFIFFYHKKIYLAFLKKIKKQILENKLLSLLIVSLIMIELLYTIGVPKNFDSYLYHINSIQWNEKYSVVPGLSNLHDRFGFNSSQFVLSSAFSFNGLYNQYVFFINSLCFLIFLIWIVLNVFKKEKYLSLMALFFTLFFFIQFYTDLSSPSTDLLPNLLFGFVLLNLLFDEDSFKKKYLLFISIPFFILTLKLSFAPVVILTFIAIYYKSKNVTKSIVQSCIYGCIFVLPWIIRNIYLSGYIIYPMDGIDILNLNWKVPKENTIEIKRWIYSWGRIPFKEHNEVLAMSFFEWFSIWWKNCIFKNKVFFLLSTISPVLLLLNYLIYKKIKSNLLIISIVSFATFLFWLFTAPDIRFSFSALLISSIISIVIFKEILFNNKIVNLFLLLFMGSFFYYTFIINGYNLFIEEFKSFKKIDDYYYLPKDVYYEKYLKKIDYNSLKFETKGKKNIEIFQVKENGMQQCYDQFPCAWKIDKSLKLRGESLQEGFYIQQ